MVDGRGQHFISGLLSVSPRNRFIGCHSMMTICCQGDFQLPISLNFNANKFLFVHCPNCTRLFYISAVICKNGLGYWLLAIGFPLLTDSRNWLTATNSFELQQEAYSRYGLNSGKPISAISWLAYCYELFAADAPLNWISHIFWLSSLKPLFCYLTSKVP